MAKIFIFGGSGRVATDLIKNLVADGNTITAAARQKILLNLMVLRQKN